jgi:hypothetical protein
VSVARFIADQRTNYRVPHTITCALRGGSTSWFYKWIARTPTPSERRRATRPSQRRIEARVSWSNA